MWETLGQTIIGQIQRYVQRETAGHVLMQTCTQQECQRGSDLICSTGTAVFGKKCQPCRVQDGASGARDHQWMAEGLKPRRLEAIPGGKLGSKIDRVQMSEPTSDVH